MNKKKSLRSSHIAGFSLLEILVAITIMMVIAAIGVVSYTTVSRNARNSRRVSDLEQMRQALEMYRSDNGFYPVEGNNESVATVGTVLITGGYLQKVPVDPKGTAYTYEVAVGDVATQGVQYCVSATLEGTVDDAGTCNAAIFDDLPEGANYGLGNP